MDTGKFDDLTREFGGGASRRSVLKRMLGIGGAAVAGSALFADSAEAARRPTPTPRPIRCPGNQIVVDGQYQCPGGASMCGAECCPDGEATCCDNACCYGLCYGEELCCEGSLGQQALVCDSVGGITCCAAGEIACCTTDGCCSGACYGGMDGAERCCPAGSFVIDPGHCCPGSDDIFCAVDGCCEGECYGGEGGTDFCCLSSGVICNESECCADDARDCCSEDGCCTGECYGGSDGESFCCSGILCEDDDGVFCIDGGGCCDDYGCMNDPVTCQVGVCQDYTCVFEGNGCSADQSCCGGDCCDPDNCCQNEGGHSICLTTEPGLCCTAEDCGAPPPSGCVKMECQYDSDSGRSFCAIVSTCFRTGEICCDNVCLQGTTCPECSEDADCPSECADSSTALIGACVRGECVLTRLPCSTIDPCESSTCQDGQCVAVPPATCNPAPGIVCCQQGWTCPIGGTECVCMEQYQCEDGRCGQCCDTNDCVSNEYSPGCIECQGASCVAINDEGSCNDGFGTCSGGYCFNRN